jgi:membrane protein DedA with SNARE-associated domain
MAYFDALIQYVGSHPYFAFVAIFLLALSEAIPVIGTVVPGSSLILAISALATTADVNPWLLLVAAAVGAIVGDGLSYWLGHRYHREILSGWPFSRFPGLIKRSAHFIRRHGITSVFLARFTAVVRAFVPLLAGIMKMSSTHFYVANVLSALVWAPLMAINLAGAHAAILGLKFVAALIVASMAWHVLRDHFRAKIDMQQPTKPKDVPVKEPPMREPERKEPPAREPERKEPPAPPSIDKPPRPSTPPPARLAKPAVLINSTVTPMLRKAKLVR